MPTRVKVGEHDYRLVTDLSRAADCDVNYGATFPARCEIVLNPEQAPTQMRDTVLHELFHAVCDNVGLSDHVDAPKDSVLTRELEERVVRALATGILSLLRRNPRLVAYLVAP